VVSCLGKTSLCQFIKAGIAGGALPGWVLRREVLNAAVPVLKLQFRGIDWGPGAPTVELDTSFCKTLEDTEAMLELLRDCPPLRPLFLVLKEFLSRHGLADYYRDGGIHSFALGQLLLAYVRHRVHVSRRGGEFKWDLGSLLLGFLR
jgi:DNA polymerase sigma